MKLILILLLALVISGCDIPPCNRDLGIILLHLKNHHGKEINDSIGKACYEYWEDK